MPEIQESVPVKKIQAAAGLKFPGRPEAEVYNPERYSTEEQAEHLWGFYTDYRRQEAEIRRRAVEPKGALRSQWEAVLAARDKLEAARQKCGYFYSKEGKLYKKAEAKPTETDVKDFQAANQASVGARNQFDGQLMVLAARDPEIQNTIRKIQALWKRPETQKAFRSAYAAAEKQRLDQRKETTEYGFLKQHLRIARDRFFGLLRTKYVNSHLAPMTLQIDIDLAENGLKAAQDKVDGVIRPEEPTRENTDRAALAKYKDLREYARDFWTKKFIWSSSRLKLLDNITENLANRVPTLLVGEAGSGKTQLARTAVRLLQGEYPRYVAGAPYSPARSELAGVQEIDPQKGTKWTFGELVAAATGFQDSEEMKAHLNKIAEAVEKGIFRAVEAAGSIIFIDEANLFDPGAFESYIKSIEGLQPGESFRMGALPGVGLKIAEKGFGMLLAINQADARYSNRNEFPPSLARVFINGWTEVDYPEMEIGEAREGKQENKCELFDMLVSALMTRDGRLLLAPSQLQPVYEKADVDKAAGTHTTVVDMARANFLDYTEEETGRGGAKRKVPKEPNHGALFRFSLLVRATNDLFSSYGKSAEESRPVILPGESKPLTDKDKLCYTVLGLGVVMKWMEKKLGNRAGIDLNYEMWKLLKHFSKTIPKTASEDLRVFRKLSAAYGFDLSLVPEEQVKPYSQVLTPKEIGYLSPEVPRPILQKGEEVGPQNKAFFDKEGNQHSIDVNSLTVEWAGDVWTSAENERREFNEGISVEVKIGNVTRNLRFLGVDQKSGSVVFSESDARIEKPMRFPRERFEKMVQDGSIQIVPGRRVR